METITLSATLTYNQLWLVIFAPIIFVAVVGLACVLLHVGLLWKIKDALEKLAALAALLKN